MTRYFCDLCGGEIEPGANACGSQHAHIKKKLGEVTVELVVLVNGSNAGHVCAECVLRVANEGDTLPRGVKKGAVVPSEYQRLVQKAGRNRSYG